MCRNYTPKVGDTLEAKTTGYAAASYQWYADGEKIEGETDATLLVTDALLGKEISVSATAENAEVVYSDETAAVAEPEITLTDVKQTTSKSITLTFDNDDAATYITAEDIVIDSVDGTRHVPVLKLDWADDGLTALATLTLALEDEVTYNVVCGESEILLVASVGEVASIGVKTTTAQQNTRTKIEFSLYNADGVDITDSIAINSTCRVDIDGDATLESSTASNSWITMTTVGETAEVTVTYNNNEADFEDVVGIGKVTCVDAEAVYGEPVYLNTSTVNDKSKCAKFYKSQTAVTTPITLAKNTSLLSDYGTLVYFCALDDNGDPISYTNYTVESADPDIMSAELADDTSGRFCSINVTGADTGTANLVIKATFNNKESYYTIPVVVTEAGKLATLSVTPSKTTMTNAIDYDYYGTLTIVAKDSNGKKLTAGTDYDYSVEIVDKDKKAGLAAIEKQIEEGTNEALKELATGFDVTNTDGGLEVYVAYGASGGSRTIKVTASDGDVELTQSKNINVKALTKGAWNTNATEGTALTYAIELGDSSIKETEITTARLVAKAGSDFAGYVRQDENGLTTIGASLGTGKVVGAKAEAALTGGTKFTATRKGADLNGYAFKTVAPAAAVAATTATANLKAWTVEAKEAGVSALTDVQLIKGTDPTPAAAAIDATSVLTLDGGDYKVTFTRAASGESTQDAGDGAVTGWTAATLQTALRATTTAIDTTADLDAKAIMDALKDVKVTAVAGETDADTVDGTFAGGEAAIPAKIAGTVSYEPDANPDDTLIGTYTFVYDTYANETAANTAWLATELGATSKFEITAWAATDGAAAESAGGITPKAVQGTIVASAKTTITDVTAGVKRGTYYSVNGKLYNNKTNFVRTIDNLAPLSQLVITDEDDPTLVMIDGVLILDACDNGAATPYYVVGSTNFDEVFAQPGTYTVQFTYVDNNGKTQKPNTNLKVTSSIWTPSVTVLSTTPESLSESDILEVLKADVDMNNNTSFHESIEGGMYSKLEWKYVTADGAWELVKTEAEENASGQFTTKYMGVIEDGIMFYVPVAKTFKAAS